MYTAIIQNIYIYIYNYNNFHFIYLLCFYNYDYFHLQLNNIIMIWTEFFLMVQIYYKYFLKFIVRYFDVSNKPLKLKKT